MTLTDFLLARIAEDQAKVGNGWMDAPGDSLHTVSDCDCREDHPYSTYLAIDPARLLAECEAKRRIVELHAMESGPSMYYNSPDVVGCQTCTGCGVTGDEFTIEGPCPTLLALALPYADHSDFRPEWRA